MFLSVLYPVLLHHLQICRAVLPLIQHRHHHHRGVATRHVVRRRPTIAAASGPGDEVYKKQEPNAGECDRFEPTTPPQLP